MTTKTSWLPTLQQAAAASSITQVAAQLGYSRTAVSLALRGKYPGNPACLGQRVLERLGQITCPHNGLSITPAQCRATAQGRAPTHHAAKMALWRSCQHCPHHLGD